LVKISLPDGTPSLDDENLEFILIFYVLLGRSFTTRSWNFMGFCYKKQARIERKIKLWKTQEILKERDN